MIIADIPFDTLLSRISVRMIEVDLKNGIVEAIDDEYQPTKDQRIRFTSSNGKPYSSPFALSFLLNPGKKGEEDQKGKALTACKSKPFATLQAVRDFALETDPNTVWVEIVASFTDDLICQILKPFEMKKAGTYHAEKTDLVKLTWDGVPLHHMPEMKAWAKRGLLPNTNAKPKSEGEGFQNGYCLVCKKNDVPLRLTAFSENHYGSGLSKDHHDAMAWGWEHNSVNHVCRDCEETVEQCLLYLQNAKRTVNFGPDLKMTVWATSSSEEVFEALREYTEGFRTETDYKGASTTDWVEALKRINKPSANPTVFDNYRQDPAVRILVWKLVNSNAPVMNYITCSVETLFQRIANFSQRYEGIPLWRLVRATSPTTSLKDGVWGFTPIDSSSSEWTRWVSRIHTPNAELLNATEFETVLSRIKTSVLRGSKDWVFWGKGTGQNVLVDWYKLLQIYTKEKVGMGIETSVPYVLGCVVAKAASVAASPWEGKDRYFKRDVFEKKFLTVAARSPAEAFTTLSKSVQFSQATTWAKVSFAADCAALTVAEFPKSFSKEEQALFWQGYLAEKSKSTTIEKEG